MKKILKLRLRMHGADGGCAACPNGPATDFPPALTGTAMVLSGGFAGFVLMKAGVSFTNITLEAEWETKITAKDVLVRMNGCRVKGSKGDSTPVTRTRGACGAEEVVKRNQTWEITDVGNDDDFTMHDLYRYIQDNYSCLRIAFITCDYRLYGFTGAANAGTLMVMKALLADDNIPETQDDDAFLKLSVTTEQPNIIKPISLPFLPNLAVFIN